METIGAIDTPDHLPRPRRAHARRRQAGIVGAPQLDGGPVSQAKYGPRGVLDLELKTEVHEEAHAALQLIDAIDQALNAQDRHFPNSPGGI